MWLIILWCLRMDLKLQFQTYSRNRFWELVAKKNMKPRRMVINDGSNHLFNIIYNQRYPLCVAADFRSVLDKFDYIYYVIIVYPFFWMNHFPFTYFAQEDNWNPRTVRSTSSTVHLAGSTLPAGAGTSRYSWSPHWHCWQSSYWSCWLISPGE